MQKVWEVRPAETGPDEYPLSSIRIVGWNPGPDRTARLENRIDVLPITNWPVFVLFEELGARSAATLRSDNFVVCTCQDPDRGLAFAAKQHMVKEVNLLVDWCPDSCHARLPWEVALAIWDVSLSDRQIVLGSELRRVKVAALHVHPRLATNHVSATTDRLEQVIELCLENGVDVLHMDGNQSISTRPGRDRSSWDQAMLNVMSRYNLPTRDLLKGDVKGDHGESDCCAFWLPCWSNFLQIPLRYYGDLTCPPEYIAVRASDWSWHHPTFLMFCPKVSVLKKVKQTMRMIDFRAQKARRGRAT